MGDSERPRPWLASLSPPHQAVPAPVRLQRRYEAAQRGHGNSAVTSPRAGVLSRDVAYRPHLPPGSVLRKRRRNALYPPSGSLSAAAGPGFVAAPPPRVRFPLRACAPRTVLPHRGAEKKSPQKRYPKQKPHPGGSASGRAIFIFISLPHPFCSVCLSAWCTCMTVVILYKAFVGSEGNS